MARSSSLEAARSDAAAPMTARRRAECPTMKPMLRPSDCVATTSRNSEKLLQR